MQLNRLFSGTVETSLNTRLRIFCNIENAPFYLVRTIVAFANERAKCAGHVCNGDTHPCTPKELHSDKNINADLWQHDCDEWERAIAELVSFGKWTVEYNGLYPSFKDAEGKYVHIPLS